MVIPGALRRRLALTAGTSFRVTEEAGRIVLSTDTSRKTGLRIRTSSVTGLPIADTVKKASITSRAIADALADFP